MTTPPPPPLPPELIEALKERNLGKLVRALLQAPARPTPGPDAGPAPEAATRRPPTEVQAPHSRGRDLSPGEVPRSGATLWFWLVLLLLAYLGYRLWRG